ncbi:glycosyltransferase 87 family protein [Mycetocola spongiae]|uniref:glycosyltransferase 87 family protein n=1 Tax=Mycetocola spongiae TaxID=2859226 RepID=UPI001CF448AA|nr:glycosyltransferase 87 family protein [Mycetocola spongiae]UCR90263.1 DUF2029 domain-containing protein [Mycetocola spongiae]
MTSRNAPYWAIFAIVHLWTIWLSLNATGYPLGDVTAVYQPWAATALQGGAIMGITQPWVYPIAALLPMLPPMLLGVAGYPLGWLLLVTVLNAVAFAFLIGENPNQARRRAGLWWMAFTVVLGPIVFGRVDSITVPMAIVGLLLLMRHPRAATIVLSIATWMKIWPAAIIGGALLLLRERLQIFWVGLATSAAIVVLAIAIGGFPNVFSFITEQTGRGIQIEAPVAVPYLWLAALGGPAEVYYDRGILTYQVLGSGVDVLSAVMTPLLVVTVALIAFLALRARRFGTPVLRILPELVLALVLAMIVMNKVGSPQFMVWLIAPVVYGLVVSGRRFMFPAIASLVLAALTHLFYPYNYGYVIGVETWAVLVLTLRNIGSIVLLVWAIRELWRAGAAERAAVPGLWATLLGPDEPAAPATRAPAATVAEAPVVWDEEILNTVQENVREELEAQSAGRGLGLDPATTAALAASVTANLRHSFEIRWAPRWTRTPPAAAAPPEDSPVPASSRAAGPLTNPVHLTTEEKGNPS